MQIYERLPLRAMLATMARSLVIVSRTIHRCLRQRARWPWDDFEGFLDTPLRRIREQFGITVARGAAASRSAHVA